MVASSGTEEPASLILELLRQMRAELGDVRSDMATKADLASLRAPTWVPTCTHFAPTSPLIS
jgi:hypothetical protein